MKRNETGDEPDVLEGGDDVGASGTIDAMYVGLEGVHCKEFDPSTFGISEEVARDIWFVLEGDGCRPIFLTPELTEDCKLPSIIPVESNVKFDGTMFVLAKDKGYNLSEGQMIYNAFEGVCGKFPNASIKAVGIELKPLEGREAQIQARIEKGDLGGVLARVHIWTGNARLISLDGDTFLDLSSGMQVLVDSELNIHASHQFGDGNADSANSSNGKGLGIEDVSKGDEPEEDADLVEYRSVPGNCNSSNRSENLDAKMDGLTALILVLVLGRLFRSQANSVLGSAMSLLANLKTTRLGKEKLNLPPR